MLLVFNCFSQKGFSHYLSTYIFVNIPPPFITQKKAYFELFKLAVEIFNQGEYLKSLAVACAYKVL